MPPNDGEVYNNSCNHPLCLLSISICQSVEQLSVKCLQCSFSTYCDQALFQARPGTMPLAADLLDAEETTQPPTWLNTGLQRSWWGTWMARRSSPVITLKLLLFFASKFLLLIRALTLASSSICLSLLPSLSWEQPRAIMSQAAPPLFFFAAPYTSALTCNRASCFFSSYSMWSHLCRSLCRRSYLSVLVVACFFSSSTSRLRRSFTAQSLSKRSASATQCVEIGSGRQMSAESTYLWKPPTRALRRVTSIFSRSFWDCLSSLVLGAILLKPMG
ncbi:hypothetical protein FGO68_gene782 [Halteria grandinella]|uniref:Uncharacterized protein n=1 Tax=Halteria grandinella TaxID=5974 RepID=A0A8J8T7X3_HALGN|nr:hypothetical protein FGO68_gene782 [Halteria grandinella]